MNREYHKWLSPAINKEIELLVFGSTGTPVLFFPTRSARFYDYENWRIVSAIQDKIEKGLLQLFCVDSIDSESFYADAPPSERIQKHLQYEKYILNEVIPFIKNKNQNQELVAAGCSLGGYHAVNIAFRHPQYFSKVVGMSSRYDLTIGMPPFLDLFEGYFDENIYYNMPCMFVPNINDENILTQLRKLQITLAVGECDPFITTNHCLSNALRNKDICHEFYIWNEEAHRPRHWRQMVQLYL